MFFIFSFKKITIWYSLCLFSNFYYKINYQFHNSLNIEEQLIKYLIFIEMPHISHLSSILYIQSQVFGLKETENYSLNKHNTSIKFTNI